MEAKFSQNQRRGHTTDNNASLLAVSRRTELGTSNGNQPGLEPDALHSARHHGLPARDILRCRYSNPMYRRGNRLCQPFMFSHGVSELLLHDLLQLESQQQFRKPGTHRLGQYLDLLCSHRCFHIHHSCSVLEFRATSAEEKLTRPPRTKTINTPLLPFLSTTRRCSTSMIDSQRPFSTELACISMDKWALTQINIKDDTSYH